MISHITLGVTDFDRSIAFYSALFEVLGGTLKFNEPERPWAGWKPASSDWPLFIITAPFDKKPMAPGNGSMIALNANSRAQVIACHEKALSMGGKSEGAPGLRPEYHADYFGAYIRDPDGNKIGICCHRPEVGQTA